MKEVQNCLISLISGMDLTCNALKYLFYTLNDLQCFKIFWVLIFSLTKISIWQIWKIPPKFKNVVFLRLKCAIKKKGKKIFWIPMLFFDYLILIFSTNF